MEYRNNYDEIFRKQPCSIERLRSFVDDASKKDYDLSLGHETYLCATEASIIAEFEYAYCKRTGRKPYRLMNEYEKSKMKKVVYDLPVNNHIQDVIGPDAAREYLKRTGQELKSSKRQKLKLRVRRNQSNDA